MYWPRLSHERTGNGLTLSAFMVNRGNFGENGKVEWEVEVEVAMIINQTVVNI